MLEAPSLFYLCQRTRGYHLYNEEMAPVSTGSSLHDLNRSLESERVDVAGDLDA